MTGTTTRGRFIALTRRFLLYICFYCRVISPLMKEEFWYKIANDMNIIISKKENIFVCGWHKHGSLLNFGCTFNSSQIYTQNDIVLLDFGSLKCFGRVKKCWPTKQVVIAILSNDRHLNEITRCFRRASISIELCCPNEHVILEQVMRMSINTLPMSPLIHLILNPNRISAPYLNAQYEYMGHSSLNEGQRKAIMETYKMVLSGKPNIKLIDGRPGTGKSLTISNLVVQLLQGNEIKNSKPKILICAQSLAAVDALAVNIIKQGPEIRLITLGTNNYGINLCSTNIENAEVVCTTLTNCLKLKTSINHFDICIIDDATKSSEPLTLLPLTNFDVKFLVLVGDNLQIPVITESKVSFNFCTIFDKMFCQILILMSNLKSASLKTYKMTYNT